MLLIEVDITADMLVAARDKSAAMGVVRGSFTRGMGNIIGFLGEAVCQKVLGGTAENVDEVNLHYDLLIDGLKVDVKTKATSVKPLDHYSCSVLATNRQKCDAFAFCRVKSDLTRGWYLGAYERDQFFVDSRPMKKGDKDVSTGFTVKKDCYDLSIKELRTWQQIVSSK